MSKILYSISDAFKELNSLKESEQFELRNDKEVEKLADFLEYEEISEPIEQIVDINAENENELQDSYVGDIIIECPTCKTKMYTKEELIKFNDETEIEDEYTYVNVGEECPHCGATDGFNIIGKVAPYCKECECSKEEIIEPTKEEKTEEEKVEIKEEEPVEEELKDEHKCCICGGPIEGHGNNPFPVKTEGDCCDKCNTDVVIPARIEKMKAAASEKVNEELELDFVPFFFKDDEDYWINEAKYIGDNLKVENFIDDYTDYKEFVIDKFVIPVLRAPGNTRETEELIKYFEINWPKKAHLAKRLFDKNLDENKNVEEKEECLFKEWEEFDENSFDSLVTEYLSENYENFNSYKTTDAEINENENSIIIEGLINFKSGKEKPTKFVFESVKFNSKKDKVKLYGKNEMFSNNNKSFCLKGSLKNNKMIGESLRYKYSVKVLDESKLVEGKVTTLTEKLNSSTENK